MPTGYSVDEDESGPQSLKDALRERTPEEVRLIREGRVSGYEVTFENPSLRAINCTATVYRSREAAERVLDIGNELAPENARQGGAKIEPANIDEAIGDDTAAFNVEFEGGPGFLVNWRYRNLLGLCVVAGVGPLDPADTIRVATAEQERFEAALG